jgi:hypothetical protein
LNQEQLQNAFNAFDAYNKKDPNQESYKGTVYPKELLYAVRMTEQLNKYAPNVPEYLQLAARCQHIGRWEIPRKSYPMDRKGYLQWRNELKKHHTQVAEEILLGCNYDHHTIEIVKFLLNKRELQQNPDTQLLEDVICLVFIEFYLEDFAAQHETEKVVDIIRKTMKKMTHRAIDYVGQLQISDKVGALIQKAADSPA